MKCNRKTKDLRFRLTTTFIAFALLIIGLLWLLEVSLSSGYYEYAMEKKSEAAIKFISNSYQTSSELNINDFADKLTALANRSDIFIYIKAEDDSFKLTTIDNQSYGRITTDSTLIDKAMAMLDISDGDTISFLQEIEGDSQVLVNAKYITSQYRTAIFLVTTAALTPLGPAMGIMRSLLIIVTIIALILSGLFAFFYSKRMARPAAILTEKAKELSKGNYNVDFTVKGYREIEDLASTLTLAAEDLNKSNQLQKDLMANVSHDLRTPLTMIKSYAELVRDISGDNKEKRDEHLQVIIDESDRLADLVGDILTLSKLQAGTEKLDFTWFNFKEAAESVLNVFKVLEESDGFHFSFSAPEEKILVYGDEQMIKRVISNYISNAVKYSTENNKNIDISITLEGDRAKLSVKDYGQGIAEEDLKTIWNRYEKASSRGTRAIEGSTGLGLSISREILEKSKANFGVDSSKGFGSNFWFSLYKKSVLEDKTVENPEI